MAMGWANRTRKGQEMKATVVPIRPGVPANLNALPDIDTDYTTLVRALVNRLVREYVHGGGKINRLALKANLNPRTVSKLAYYETTRPMWHTVMAVIIALGALKEFSEITARFAARM